MKPTTRTIIVAAAGALTAGGTGLAVRKTTIPGWAKWISILLAFTAPFAVDFFIRRARAKCTLIYVSDTHGSAVANQPLVSALRAEQDVDFWVTGGDVSDSVDLWRAWWDTPFGEFSPWLAASGNHDVDTPENAAAFARRFGKLPRAEHCGDVDIYVLPWRVTTEVGTWLATEVEASTAAWRIVVAHHPLWSAADGGWESYYTRSVRRRLEAALPRVDLVLVGHDHVSWDSVHAVGGHQVRQIVEVSGPKFYECDEHAVGCVSHSRGYLRITASASELLVERKALP